MSTLIIILVILAIVVVGALHFRKSMRSGCCGTDSAPEEKAARVADRNRAHYPYAKRLTIDGMTCQNCARHVQNALNALDGTLASVELGKRSATVHMKHPLPETLLRQAVRGAGYTIMAISEIK